jgi:hypothetical protein
VHDVTKRIKEAGGAVEFIKGAWRVTTVEVP